MRLLDRVASCKAPLLLALDRNPAVPLEVTGPAAYASRVAECPLRFVLGDDVTRASAELAFADGARLVGCLDLLRMPAHQVWIEWNDEIHQRVVYDTRSVADYDPAAASRRVGVLLQASLDGYRARARTFWVDAAADESSEVILSPLETHIDLRGEFVEASDIPTTLSGGLAAVAFRGNAAIDTLLNHVRFRFDAAWARYFRAAATDPEGQRRAVHNSLAAVARDVPLILAFFLLLSAKDATRSVSISRNAINRKRQANGRSLLLDHIEVHESLDAVQQSDGAAAVAGRQSPRLHHVRGHLVRRDNSVFWRMPHLRGSGARGMVRSRTVCLSFARPRVGAYPAAADIQRI